MYYATSKLVVSLNIACGFVNLTVSAKLLRYPIIVVLLQCYTSLVPRLPPLKGESGI